MPDVGEGVAEAELVEWFVDVGDSASTPDPSLAEVLTDKATVEISRPSPGRSRTCRRARRRAGRRHRVRRRRDRRAGGPQPRKRRRATAGVDPVDAAAPSRRPRRNRLMRRRPRLRRRLRPRRHAARPPPRRARRARRLGIDLRHRGTGPDGRVVHADLDRASRCPRRRRLPTPQPATAQTRARAAPPDRRTADASWTESRTSPTSTPSTRPSSRRCGLAQPPPRAAA